MPHKHRKRLQGIGYTIPMIVGLAIFFIIPFIFSVEYIVTIGIAKTEFVGVKNIIDLAANPAYLLSLKNTLKFTAVCIPLVVTFAVIIGKYLAEHFAGVLQNLLLLPYIMPVAACVLGWNIIFGTSGFLGLIFAKIFNTDFDFYAEPAAFWLLVFMYLIKNLGYMSVIICGAISALPKACREAFLLESKSETSYTLHIILPLISPVIFFVGILSLVNCFQSFREIYAIYGYNPPSVLYMLQNFLNNNFMKFNYARLCAASFIVTAFIATLVGLYIYITRKYEDKR